MTININLDLMMAKRKIRLKTLSQLVGITEANLSILKNGKAKAVRLSTLNKLCEALACQPGDLITYENDKQNKTENIKLHIL